MNALTVLISLLAFRYSNDLVEANKQRTNIVTKFQASNPFNQINGGKLKFRYSNSRLGIKKSKDIEFGKESSILSKNWIYGLPLKVITHGWLASDNNFKGVFTIRDAYVQTGGYNVITVDWSVYAFEFYLRSARFTQSVGKRIAEFLDRLIERTKTKTSDIHLIGHSLGSHIMGSCGAHVKSGKIGRITGLDPAKPGFKIFFIQTEHLDPSDAAFVDVIHTAGGTFGYLSSLGHIDFYPNSGTAIQPGCGISFVCSHMKAIHLYRDSVIDVNKFRSVLCFSWYDFQLGKCVNNLKMNMGHNAKPGFYGHFYLRTE